MLILDTLGALVSDVASYNQISVACLLGMGASETGKALLRLFEKRIEDERRILLEELERGDRKAWTLQMNDKTLALLYRYHNASINGSARLNLRLMAKVIKSMVDSDTIFVQDFLSYAETLSTLRQEEIILLAIIHKLCEAPENQNSPGIPDGESVWRGLQAELIPKPFASAAEIQSVSWGLMRTGFLTQIATLGNYTYFVTSVLFNKLLNLAAFDEALMQEGVNV